jgi:hypothetical protein
MDEEAGYGCGCLLLVGVGILLFKPLSNFFAGLIGGILQVLLIIAFVVACIFAAWFIIRSIVEESSERNRIKKIESEWSNFWALANQQVSEGIVYSMALAEFGLEEGDVQIFSPIIQQYSSFNKNDILEINNWGLYSKVFLFGETRMYHYINLYDVREGKSEITANIINYSQIISVSMRDDMLVVNTRGYGKLEISLDNDAERNTARGLRNLFSEEY